MQIGKEKPDACITDPYFFPYVQVACCKLLQIKRKTIFLQILRLERIVLHYLSLKICLHLAYSMQHPS
jgi:hypothetical protein